MKVLFVCNQNKHRSKTAELVLKDRFETRSAGLYSEPSVSENDLYWADTIVVMEEEMRMELAKRFPKQIMQKRMISFDIPDTFFYNQPRLIEVLNSKAELV